uniref:non-specific serine/threonine protein kinase n=1 Tax=Strongylocentrotus purpuratus TaxID=7668 RepID=B0FWN6_STRPU|nr:ataxia telangiectasia mutated [Strongylocentrotus purpuratus]ABY60856.1 ataxia telangiectasia mutated [Strongylocentrotus purpuratus]
MAEVLIPLRTACGYLGSDKITERKKQIDIVKKELNKKTVQLQLDKHTLEGKSNFTWQEVFKCVWAYIVKEIELLKGKGASSSRTSTTNQTRKREVRSTLKWIVGVANGRGPKLSVVKLVKKMIFLLKDDFTGPEFGADCCSIITRDVLGCQKYWHELDQRTWIELIETVTMAIHHTDQGVSLDPQARAVQSLVAGATIQGALPTSYLFNFFGSMLKRIRTERSTTVISCTLSALNIFSLHVAPDRRHHLCKLGEESLTCLLLAWRSNTAQAIRDELVTFLRLQMSVHHPMGVMTQEQGAYAGDFDQWKNQLTSLYEELVREWRQEGFKLKLKGAGKRDVNFKQDLVELAADVCHQIFNAGSVSYEVSLQGSQVPSTSRLMSSQMRLTSQVTTPSKRRRLESGWELLREYISQPLQHASILPWLQLLAALVTKYPKDLPEEEYALFVSALHNLQAHSKRSQLQSHVLSCLQCIAASQESRQEFSQHTKDQLSREWSKVWSATIRTICLHSAEDEGFDLLTSLVHHGIVKLDKEVWKLFLPDVTQPSRCSVTFLLTLLTSHPIPENHVCQVGLLASLTGVQRGQYPLRHQLLNWILPAEEVEDAGERLAVTPLILKSVPRDLLASLLTTLFTKNCRGQQLGIALAAQPNPENSTPRLSFVEELYLRASFHIPLTKDSQVNAVGHDTATAPSTEGAVIMMVVQSVLERLGHVVKLVTDSQCKEVDHYEMSGQLACMLSRVLERTIRYSEKTAREAAKIPLKKHITVLLKRFALGFKVLEIQSDLTPDSSISRAHSLKSLCSVLLPLYACQPGQQGEAGQMVASLVRSCTPAELLDALLDVLHKRGSCQKQGSKVTNHHDPFGDSMELGSDDEFPSTQQAQGDLDDDFGEVTTISAQATTGTSEKKRHKSREDSMTGTHSMLSIESLPHEEQLAISSAKVLSSWCWSCDFSDQVTSESRDNRTAVTQRLLKMLDDEEDQDLTNSYEVQLFFAVVSSLREESNHIHDDELNGILQIWRELVSVNRKVQEVCAEAMAFLRAITPHLAASGSDDGMVSSHIKECRGAALLLLAAFWQLQATYSTPVKHQMALCIEALIKIDPDSQWTFIKAKGREKGHGDSNERSEVATLFPNLLQDSTHEVRMHMATAVGCLFNTPGTQPYKTETQNQAFNLVYQSVEEAMQISDDFGEAESKEENKNRTASLLLTLANVALSSHVCEKKTIFALLLTTKINRIPSSVMKKVLSCIAEGMSHCSSGPELAILHLGFLVYQWLQESYEIREFPYGVLGCSSSQEFLSKHHAAIIPHLVNLKKLDTVKTIAGELKQDWKDLLKSSFPRTIASLLPLLAQSRENSERAEEEKERAAWAVQCLEELKQAIGQETLNAWIQSHLDLIVVELLTMLYEPWTESSQSSRFMTPSDPEPDPPFFTSYMIKATLDHLTTCHAGGRSLTLISLLAKTHDSIQKVLLELHLRMWRCQQPYERRRLLLGYRLFGLLLIKELHTKLGGSWVYVLQDLIYTLVHTIHQHRAGEGRSSVMEGSSSLVLPCLDLLRHISEAAVVQCSEEFSKHIEVILGAVVPLVGNTHNDVSKQALSLVEFLVVENHGKLKAALLDTNPLPDKAELKKARKVLEKIKNKQEDANLLAEINHFLMRGGQHCKNHTLEGLNSLHHELASRKAELAMLVSMCAESASDSVLPQLICELVSLCGSNHSNQDGQASALQKAAGQCLGEIGSPDLSVIALKKWGGGEQSASYSTAVKRFSDNNDRISCRNSVILHLLKEYLTDPCVDVVAASAKCLKMVLGTRSGQTFYEQYRDQNIDTLLAYLYPFKTSKNKMIKLPAIDSSDEAFMRHVGEESLWQPVRGSHEEWLKDLTLALIKSGGVRDEILRLLEPICLAKVEFAERVFPYLIHDILTADNMVYRQILSEQIKGVFSAFTDSVSDSRAPTPMPGSLDQRNQGLGQRSIKTLLDTIHYLRTQERSSRTSRFTPWDNNFWLEVDYLQMAKAAQMCEAHFTCLLYSEIWCNEQRMTNPPARNGGAIETFSQDSQDSASLASISMVTGINLQTLLMEAFGSIGEPDSVYGCGAGRLVDTNARIHTYEHEGEWGKALAAYDLQMQSSSSEATQLGLLKAMQNFGLSGILQTYLAGQKAQGQQCEGDQALLEYQYEAAWRNGLWDLDLEESSVEGSLGYHENVFRALCSLKTRDQSSYQVAVERATTGLTHLLAHVSLESVQRIYPLVTSLRGLQEISNVAPFILRHRTDSLPIFDAWTSQLPLMNNSFEFSEPTLALRSILSCLVPDAMDGDQRRMLHDGIASHLKTQIQWARDAERFQVAERALVHLKELEQKTDQNTVLEGCSSSLEEAQLFWAKNERTTALHLMKALIDKLSKSQDSSHYKIYATTLSIHGNWLAETRSQSPNVIMEDYLEKAFTIFHEKQDMSAEAVNAYHSLARFADAQYQRLVEYMKSKDYEDKRKLMKTSLENVEKLRSIGIGSSDRFYRIQAKQLAIDKKEVESLREDRQTFLARAMECYLHCLEASDQSQDTRVFRLCSLWFENGTDVQISLLLEDTIGKIESRKFLPMMYQLAARMTTKVQGKEQFYTILNALIERVAADHPHHALPVILALANANLDSVINSKKTKLGRSSGGGDLSQTDKDRMQAAVGMRDRLMAKTPCCDIIPAMNKLSEAYIKMAYWDMSSKKSETRPISIASNQPLLHLKSLHHVAVPTLELKVDASCCYDDIVYVEGFEPTFKLAGGVNLPKIITCRGSDGVKRRQLVKGKDDLRQDAVMQQVFGLVNQLLSKSTETKRRKLQIRRYKVVPLCQNTGLLEWCEGTMPIGLYLIGDAKKDLGAHASYRPGDWKTKTCRGKMAAAHQSGDNNQKFRDFTTVCRNFQPVFHHFFLERFLDPADWFEKRLSYTRSVATGSIVGYVVGLGDRHVQNILIDCNTAELVHIDLGIAFEQGRNLPTPETVPFRLTRDLVDAMGVAGVEGVFRRCSEKTMEEMHNSREALLTVVEVLLYDPLYTWTMSPARALELQALDRTEMGDQSELNTTTDGHQDILHPTNGASSPTTSREEVNQVAERVLLRLRQKLGGVEDGVTLSVAGQVSLLIQEARDPKNLSRLYPGWSPWL